MKTELSDKDKAVLSGYFGKAAAFHEEAAAGEKEAADSHRIMAEAHRNAHKASGDKVEKVFHKAGYEHHCGKVAHHEKLRSAHSAMGDACKAAAFDLGSDGAKAAAPTDLTKNAPDVVADFWRAHFPSYANILD